MKTSKVLCAGTALFAAVLFFLPVNLLAADAGSITGMASQATAAVQQLNINTASVEALSGIPGVGQKIGEAIGTYRDTNGAFKSVADLVKVDGIDAGLLEKIKPFLTL